MLPAVTAARMREIDRQATQERGLRVIDLMENAGRAVAAEVQAYFGKVHPGRIAVCCGRGANGGDGLVAARYLKEDGLQVQVFLCAPKGSYPEPVAVNLERAKAAGIAVAATEDEAALQTGLAQADVILDGLLGTGSSGKPTGIIVKVIEAMASSGKPVAAIDLPSGLDPDTGAAQGACAPAVLTLTLGLPKIGLLAAQARQYVGEIKVLDVGFPQDLLHP